MRKFIRGIGRFAAKLGRAALAHPDAILAAAGVHPVVFEAAKIAVANAERACRRGDGHAKHIYASKELLAALGARYSRAMANTAIELAQDALTRITLEQDNAETDEA